jgi:hypothetical protein
MNHTERAMRHNPILKLFSLLRPIRLRRPPGDRATGQYRPAEIPLIDYLLGVDSSTTEPSMANILARLLPEMTETKPESGISMARSSSASSPAHRVERSGIVLSDPMADSVTSESGWAAFPSRTDTRRLRVVDRAIAEIARQRRLR